jgi:oxygen-independent coproporphyrinogen-3 oxidase
MDSLKKGILKLPQEDEALEMSSLALDTLARSGYRRYEVSNYSLPGHECGHNLNYWRRGEYIGAGAGAYSFSGQRRDRNTPDIRKYIDLLSEGRAPVGESALITPEEAMREFLFLGLRLTEGVDMAWFRDELGLDLAGAAGELLGDGLAETEGGRLRLTRRGLLLFNPVVVRLMERLGL